MKINIRTLLEIIFISILLAFSNNYFSPKGIPLIAKEKTLQWAEDSLIFPDYNDLPENKDTMNIAANKNSITEGGKEADSQYEITPEKVEGKINKYDITKDEQAKKEKPELTEPAVINLKQAYSLYQQNILFIDAREPGDYQYAHIKNAINIPFDHFDSYSHLLDNIDKDKTLVIYCAGTDCDLSIFLGNLLFEKGYKQVYIFFGGWNEWTQANYPVEEGNQTE